MRQSWFAGVTLGTVLLLVGGCVTPPRSGYVPPGEPGVMTADLDDHDYDLVAEGLAGAFLSHNLPRDYVVALGPVDTRDSLRSIQVLTLQKKLQVILNRDGRLKFMAAVDGTGGRTGAQEIYRIIEFNWHNRNPFDREDMQKYGKLANVNGILFGRASSLERRLPTGGTEVTYTFVWELANTETGLLDISWEKKIRKNVR